MFLGYKDLICEVTHLVSANTIPAQVSNQKVLLLMHLFSLELLLFLMFLPEDNLLKYLPLNLILKVLIEVFEFQLVKALIQFSVLHVPTKVCYQIWH